MGVTANVQGIATGRLTVFHNYTNCSVTSVGHACLFTVQALLLS